jgi:hypothetical protein
MKADVALLCIGEFYFALVNSTKYGILQSSYHILNRIIYKSEFAIKRKLDRK